MATLMNFNRSAQVLNYAQSTVSAQIKALEEEIGVPLFERIGKQVTLTKAGEQMLDYTHKLLAIEEEALSAVSGSDEPAGLLTLRVPQTIATYYLPQVLARFQPLFPKVRLDISSCAYYSLERELKTGSVDLAFLLADTVRSAQLEVEMLKVTPLVLVVASRHPLRNKTRVTYRDLKNYPVFLPKSDCGYRMGFEQVLAGENASPPVIIEINSIEAIKKCVMAGLGITIIPRMAVMDELAAKRLVALDWMEDWEVAVLMIRHKERWLSPTLLAFMDAVRGVVSEP